MPIVDDQIDEMDECFSASLTFVSSDSQSVTLDPSTADVLVQDNDGECSDSCTVVACLTCIPLRSGIYAPQYYFFHPMCINSRNTKFCKVYFYYFISQL